MKAPPLRSGHNSINRSSLFVLVGDKGRGLIGVFGLRFSKFVSSSLQISELWPNMRRAAIRYRHPACLVFLSVPVLISQHAISALSSFCISFVDIGAETQSQSVLLYIIDLVI